jgi:predicted outer membrane repeat protein
MKRLLRFLVCSFGFFFMAGSANGATFTVTTLNDAGHGSLRDAIVLANYQAGSDEIRFNTGLSGTITLVSPLSEITDDLAIIAQSPGSITIQGGFCDCFADKRIFNFSSTSGTKQFSISNLIIKGGKGAKGGDAWTVGGAIKVNNNCKLTIDNSQFLENQAEGYGGAISNSGELIITNSVFKNNTVTKFTGAAISNAGKLTATNTIFESNTAQHGAGAILTAPGSETRFTNVQIKNNTASNARGGGMWINGPTYLTDVVVEGNKAADLGGGIFNEGMLTLLRVKIINNTGSGGGGIATSWSTKMEDVIISGNHATSSGFGGGIQTNQNLTIKRATISNNDADNGGGIFRYSGTVNMENVTISGNKARTDGGGIYSHTSVGDVVLTNVTIALNDAARAGDGILNNKKVIIKNSIIANEGSSTGVFVSEGYNIESGHTCGLTQATDKRDTDPLLLPLADNGGFSMTHAIKPNSPAIDNGNDAVCPELDQRGTKRIDGNKDGTVRCDIGAYESSIVIQVAPMIKEKFLYKLPMQK